MDIHLDTSWCPVCDKAIMPKRFVVPIPSQTPEPIPQQPPAPPARASQTTTARGKGNKSRFVGGGLLHGTGRIRPGGGLRRENSANNVNSKDRSPQKQNAAPLVAPVPSAADLQRQNSTPLRQRTVIDQAQTPLYCSEECRKIDLEWSFADSPAQLENQQRGRPIVDIAPHPSELNPSRYSPPPPPPVPPNSLRVSATVSEAEQSDSSSSGSGESFGTSSSSAGKLSPFEHAPMALREVVQKVGKMPVPPEIPPMPLHPHRPSAPVRKPKENTASGSQSPPFEGGIIMAARRLQALYFPAAGSEVKVVKEFDLKNAPRGVLGRGDNDVKREVKKEVKDDASYDWKKVVYGVPESSYELHSRSVAMVHRRSSTPATNDTATTSQARTQSALDLYSKCPIFTKAKSRGSMSSLSAVPTISTSLSHSYATEFAKTRSMSPEDMGMERRQRKEERRRTVQEPLYEGRKMSTKQYEPRSILPSGAEGKLLVPNVMLPPLVSSTSRPAFGSTNSFPSIGSRLGSTSRVSSAPTLRRNESEMSVSRESARSGLNSVAEEGQPGDACERKGDGRAESRQARRERRAKKSVRGGSETSGSPTRSETTSTAAMTAPERRRFNMTREWIVIIFYAMTNWVYARTDRTWSYENLDGPKYETMPPVPILQRRFEDVFIPDDPPADPTKREQLIISPLHVRDEELSRREVKVVWSRRGVHEGVPGVFVEKEWEVRAIPERKRLFLFAGKV